MTFANTLERAKLIDGLRDLANFLDRNPEVPVPPHADLMVFPSVGTDEQMRTEIDRIAALLGTEIAETRHGHYVTECLFGSVKYLAVAISGTARESYHARNSYAENIVVSSSAERDEPK